MREQVELTFIIGWPKAPETVADQAAENWFRRQIIMEASRLCGGCTVVKATGFWREDGDEKKPTFEGEMHSEETLMLSLTCETYKEPKVYESMKTFIANIVRVSGFDVDWVHVQRRPIMGMHFSCRAINARDAA